MFCRQSTVPWCLNSFPFLAWDLSMHPSTQIWFFNQFICTGACACSSNLNYAHKCIENSVNAQKCPNEPRKITKIHTTLQLFYVYMRKKIGSNKRQWISFRPRRWDIPYRKPSCLLWEAPVCEKHIPKPGPNGNFFTMACWCRWMIACQVSWSSDEFWIY